MAMQTIKCGGFVSEEIAKVNANFSEIQNDYAKQTDIPDVPTKTSDLTNDSGFITSSAIPTVPTKTSDLTNDSGFITSAAIPTVPTKTSDLTNDSNFVKTTDAAFVNKVDKEAGKGLSTEDYTSAEKSKLAGLSAPTKVNFTTNNWTAASGKQTYTTAANSKTPTGVMRKNGSNYESVLVDVQTVGTNVVITSDEAFEGYIILV